MNLRLGQRLQPKAGRQYVTVASRVQRCAGRCGTALVDEASTLPNDPLQSQREALSNLYANEGAEEPNTFVLPPAQETLVAPPPPKQGDVVWGTVIFANHRGARVQLTDHENIIGYLPETNYPVQLPFRVPDRPRRTGPAHEDQDRQQQDISTEASQPATPATPEDTSTTNPSADVKQGPAKAKTAVKRRITKQPGSQADADVWKMPVGTTRPFVVVAYHQNQAGPLLSALGADQRLMLTRMQQIQQMLQREEQTVRATVTGFNNGGCLCSVLGLYGQAFLPFSHLQHSPQNGDRFWNARNADVLIGCELDVAMVEVIPENLKVVVSERVGSEWRTNKVLVLGNALEGTVSKVFRNYMTVKLHALPGRHANVQRQRMTRMARTPSCEEVFMPGDRVVGLLSTKEVQDTRFRLELSLMELETQDGDMLQPERRAQCFAQAQAYITQ